MINRTERTRNIAPGILLLVAVFASSLPATLYGVFWNVARVVSAPGEPAFPHFQRLQHFLAICWFIVVLMGRPLCLLAFASDVVLLLWRGQPIWLKIIGSMFVAFAVAGTLLIESQARAGRPF